MVSDFPPLVMGTLNIFKTWSTVNLGMDQQNRCLGWIVVLLPNRTFVLMERYGQQRDFIDAGGRCDAQPQQRRRSMTDRLDRWLMVTAPGRGFWWTDMAFWHFDAFCIYQILSKPHLVAGRRGRAEPCGWGVAIGHRHSACPWCWGAPGLGWGGDKNQGFVGKIDHL